MDEIKNLFDLASEFILKDLNMENVPILSEIAKVKQDFGEDNYDFHSVKNVLELIDHYFNDYKHTMERQMIFESFAARLMVENAKQIEEKYNSVMDNIRKYYPKFNLVHRDHNPFFGENGVLKCSFRKCTDDEYIKSFNNNEPFARFYHEEIIKKDLRIYKKELENKGEADFIKSCSSHRTLSCLSDGPKDILSSTSYTNNGYVPINNFLRNIKTETSLDSLTSTVSNFFPRVVLPFYHSEKFSIYRGDGQTISSDKFKTKGFYSGGLSLKDVGKFVRNGGRLIKINIPIGTPFIPIVMNRIDEGEIVLLPGTELTKDNELNFEERGHFSEYTVSNNPPVLSEYEEASVFRFVIPGLFKERVRDWKRMQKYYGNLQEAQDFIDCLPEPIGTPVEGELEKFYVELANRLYGTNW